MKSLVILVVLLGAASATAQTLQLAPQPLKLDPPAPLRLDDPRQLPGLPDARAGGGLRLPDSGMTLMPSLGVEPAPDAMPPDRRQERIPALRLRVPL